MESRLQPVALTLRESAPKFVTNAAESTVRRLKPGLHAPEFCNSKMVILSGRAYSCSEFSFALDSAQTVQDINRAMLDRLGRQCLWLLILPMILTLLFSCPTQAQAQSYTNIQTVFLI